MQIIESKFYLNWGENIVYNVCNLFRRYVTQSYSHLVMAVVKNNIITKMKIQGRKF